MSANILIIEDETAIVTLLEFTLKQAGFSVQSALSAEQGKTLLREALPDLLLVDWMLPQTSGIELVAQLRADERTRELPIIMLTAKADEMDKEQGLNDGADDYLTKPFSPRELVARIKALLRRRSPHKTSEAVQYQGLNLEPQSRQLSYQSASTQLDPAESKLLHFFLTHPKRLYSRRQLLDFVWGDHVFIEERTVDVHIRRLRKALDAVGIAHWVQTVRGEGYVFDAQSASGAEDE